MFISLVLQYPWQILFNITNMAKHNKKVNGVNIINLLLLHKKHDEEIR